MKAFSDLFARIDQTSSTNEKTTALADYFALAPDEDAIWCVALLSGHKPARTVKTAELWEWCTELSGIPSWLQAESYHIVGDLAETISLLIPPGETTADPRLHEIMAQLSSLGNRDTNERKKYVTGMWKQLTQQELLVFNKLITGGFRVGVSAKIIIKALAQRYQMDENKVAHRISGKWEISGNTLTALLTAEGNDDLSRPYPFYLAYPLETEAQNLGDISEWLLERKYDGIRGQIIVRQQQLYVWSRGEDLLTEKFTEFHPLSALLPDGTVIDGEILPVKNGVILPFHVMQTRIGRKNVTKKTLQDAPLTMICYDLLEHSGVDIRHLSLQQRRDMLANLLEQLQAAHTGLPLILSPEVQCTNWDMAAKERLRARETSSEGLMLKRKSSEYKTGRKKGDWWKWKTDPYSIDGVLLYAQRGHGRRANLYTDFTFAVWDGSELVPFCKAYSGLTDKEMLQVDNWVKKNTLDKFGPVRSVTPQLVFEIGFEGINPSPRHKSGIALRFPRILRWRQDKSAAEANTKTDLLNLLDLHHLDSEK